MTQPVVQLGLLLRRHLDKGYTHSESVALVNDFAENFQHFVVKGKAKPKLRALSDGIQRVDIAACAAVRCARTDREFYYHGGQHQRTPRRTTPLYRRIRHSASPRNQHELVRLPGDALDVFIDYW